MKQRKQFCTYSGNVIFSKVYGLKWQKYLEKKSKCNVELPILAQHIILESGVLDYFINLFIVIIKYYIYSYTFSGQKPCVSGVINILKRT